MNIKKTQKYYKQLSSNDLCSCAYYQNYIKQIKCEYPAIAEYLQKLGVDIEKPFETMPVKPDKDGYIEYIAAQYVICGEHNEFKKTTINSVNIDIAEHYPSTKLEELHFIIEIYPLRLKWAM